MRYHAALPVQPLIYTFAPMKELLLWLSDPRRRRIGRCNSPIPSPKALNILPPRNWPFVSAVKIMETPTTDMTPEMSIVQRRPSRSEIGPEAQAPKPVVS